jgi:hypothetical protein
VAAAGLGSDLEIEGVSMAISVRLLACALAALLAPIQVAEAQNIAETLSRWGLIGTWALDCGKPASNSNGYLSYVIRRAGQVSHERDFGDRQDVNEVQQARTGLGGVLELVVHFPELSQTRKYTLMMGLDGRTRAIANSKADGTEPTIKDGKFTFNGSETPWQVRCR